MTKFHQEYAEANGWSRWISPIHGHAKKNYKLACCDCSLVHNVQFRIAKEPNGRLSVIFRVQRNNRSTAAMRKHSKLKTKQK